MFKACVKRASKIVSAVSSALLFCDVVGLTWFLDPEQSLIACFMYSTVVTDSKMIGFKHIMSDAACASYNGFVGCYFCKSVFRVATKPHFKLRHPAT